MGWGVLIHQQQPTTAHHRHLDAAQRGLVLDELPERPESGIADRAGKAVVFDHAAHVQILNADGVKPARQTRRELMQGILADIADSGV